MVMYEVRSSLLFLGGFWDLNLSSFEILLIRSRWGGWEGG